MLTQIFIRDLVTIAELNLNLNHGNTMITGETGAGKSIFIEAIELALGGRASQNMIRLGKEKAEISLCFDLTHFPHVINKLQELDLYQNEPECIIRRVITIDGRSRCTVNGAPVTVQLVKELGELLFHLHGQHEQQVLIKSEIQREILDRYAEHLSLANEVKMLAEQWKEITARMHFLREKTLERANRCDYLRFQLEELNSIQLKNGEWELLEAEHHRLTHSDELLKQLQLALNQIVDDENVNLISQSHDVRKTIESIQSVEPKAKEWLATLQSAVIQLKDVEAEIRNYLSNTEVDPEKLQQLEERVSKIFNLARKHKISPAELVTLQLRLEQELQTLNSSDEELIELQKKLQLVETQYHDLADKLSLKRATSARKLEKEITATIKSLSLPHGEFKINLEKESNPFTAHGKEKINFLIKTNPDQSLQSIAKVVSGGELSRLSLATHLALANRTSIPTLVFDEVDTGLSGATAEKIGKLLRKLGESYQVFCVTHQAQVAACGHHHLLVEKIVEDKTTHTQLRILNNEEKTQEIARMLGGEKITQKTLEHAMEMMQSA